MKSSEKILSRVWGSQRQDGRNYRRSERRKAREQPPNLIEQFLDFALRIVDYCYVMEKVHIVSKGGTNELSQDVIREHLSEGEYIQ
jgi:hypothetical protein